MNMFDEFDRLFEPLRVFSTASDHRMPELTQSFDKESNTWTLEMELPGVAKDELKVSVVENQLVIKAESENLKLEKSLSLSPKIDQEKVTAKLKDGLLKIQLQLNAVEEKLIELT